MDSKERKRPTHFLAIRVKDPVLLRSLKEVQDQFLASQPRLRSAVVPIVEAHITLNVFQVEEGGLAAVKELLRSTFQENKAENPGGSIAVEGLGMFSARVLFAQPAVRDLSYLHQLHAAFMESLTRNNIKTDTRQDSELEQFLNLYFSVARTFNPHITLFKAGNSSQDLSVDRVLFGNGFV